MNDKCYICPKKCGIDRKVRSGFCGAGNKLKINACSLHFGEEPVISGRNGSGTIFFSHCNLRCVFCQNYKISSYGWGEEYETEELVSKMLELQSHGAHNINLVTPTHFTHLIREAIISTKKKGLAIPIIWNSNAYELKETLQTLEGLVDIYMPDFKYYNPEISLKYSGARDYPEFAKIAILEMFRQIGHLQLLQGLACRGLLVRLLVLPENLNSTEKILKWIAENLGNKTYISLMGQYYPAFMAKKHPEINRHITQAEYQFAVKQLEFYGFENGFIQQVGSDNSYTPDFMPNRNQ